jgi:hypothetical protein
MVSAYTTVNNAADSMTVIIVNRDVSSPHNVTVNLNDFSMQPGVYSTLQLSALPATETFKSHTDNALKSGTVTAAKNSFTIAVPALSTTAVLLSGSPASVVGVEENKKQTDDITLYPNPVSDKLFITMHSHTEGSVEITVQDLRGHRVQSYQKDYHGTSPLTIDTSAIPNGFYLLSVQKANEIGVYQFIVAR